MRHTLARFAATSSVVALTAFLGCTAAASAATANQRADHQAIAIVTKMATAEKAHLRTAQRAGTAYAKSITVACGGVLAPVINRLGSKATNDIALELVADTVSKSDIFDISVTKADTTKIANLHWTGRAATEAKAIGRYFVTFGKLGASNLCKDAKALAAHPSRVPAGTAAYVKKYKALERSGPGYSGISGLLSPNASSADKTALQTAQTDSSAFISGADTVAKKVANKLYDALTK